MKTLLIDAEKCIDCRNCQTACKDEHCDNDWSPIAALQAPRQYWIKVNNTEVGDGARVEMQRTQVVCQQCADAPCMKVAKDGAVYRREDGIVIIDPEKAQGQRAIMEACPYHAVYWNDELNIPQKCTMCAHLRDAGREPRCVTACPTDALKVVDSEDVLGSTLLAHPVEHLHPEYDTRPQVLYQQLPRPFIAGEVCTPDGGESIPNVRVTAVHQMTGASCHTVTDAFGEFKLRWLEPGYYTVSFERDGYGFKELANVDARQGINVEEVRLHRLA